MNPRFAIVGSGPAAFYGLIHLSKRFPNACIHMFEKLPMPFGLVRYGVAPDHPQIKVSSNKVLLTSQGVEKQFTEAANQANFKFFGNVTIGQDVSVSALRRYYDSVLLAFGASKSKQLNIPGSDYKRIFSAQDFCFWYNGHPDYSKKDFMLDKFDSVVVIGHGNVSLDIARILLKNVDDLRQYDLPEYCLQKLKDSRVKNVTLIGRRGPLESRFTTAEIRELSKIPYIGFKLDTDLLQKSLNFVSNKARKRQLELLLQCTKKSGPKTCAIQYFKSPKQFLSDSHTVQGIRFEKMQQVDEKIVGTGEFVDMEAPLVFTSIGWEPESLDGILNSQQGRAVDRQGNVVKGLYICGWAQGNARGTIADTMRDSFECADKMAFDFLNSTTGLAVSVTTTIEKIIQTQLVGWQDWLSLDKEELNRAGPLSKTREKWTDRKEIFEFLSARKHKLDQS